MLTHQQITNFRDEGYVVVNKVLSEADVNMLIEAIGRLERADNRDAVGINSSDGVITSIQNLPLQSPPLSRLLQYRPIVELVEQLVGMAIRVTGGLLLDKDPKHNWAIGWHQDNGIYVAQIPPGEPQDIRGGLPVLSTKGLELRHNVTCRIALDASSPGNGGLYVLPRSHHTNLWPNNDASQSLGREKGVGTRQGPGAALCYAPLLLHRSEKSTALVGRRRVLILQYGPADLALPGTTCYPFPQPVPLTAVDGLGE